jgi:hypothetical protein
MGHFKFCYENDCKPFLEVQYDEIINNINITKSSLYIIANFLSPLLLGLEESILRRLPLPDLKNLGSDSE